MHRTNYISLIALLFFSSCTTDTENNGKLKEIIPLSIGNEWNYDSNLYDSTRVLAGVFKDTVKVLRDTTINSEKWYWLYNKLYGGESYYPAKNNSTGFVVFDRNIRINEGVLRYKYPGNKGESFSVKMQFGDSVVYYSKQIISIDTTISVSSGSYSCYLFYNSHVQLNDFSQIYETESFVSPEYGLIRNNYYKTTKSGVRYIVWQTELTRLALK